MTPAAARLTPNSANCPATIAFPLIGFCAMLIVARADAAFSDGRAELSDVSPQQGSVSLATKQGPEATHVSTWNCTALPPPR